MVHAYSGSGPRNGVAISYQKGFAAATGDAFVLCEADDQCGEGWLMAMGRALEKNAFVASVIDYQKLNPPELVWGQHGAQTTADGLPHNSGPLFLPFASGCSLGLRREVVDVIGPPNEAVGAIWDNDFCWKAQLAGFPITFATSAVMHYRVRQTASARYRQAHAWGLGHARLSAKYGPPHTFRFLLYCLKRIGQTSLAVAVSAMPGQHARSVAYRMWDLGFAVGQLEGLPHIAAARRRVAGAGPTPGPQ